MIIGPPGPTGLIVIALSEPGWTIGEGSGVRRIAPVSDGARLSTLIRGGVRPGMLICVCGDGSGVPFAGETIGGGATLGEAAAVVVAGTPIAAQAAIASRVPCRMMPRGAPLDTVALILTRAVVSPRE